MVMGSPERLILYVNVHKLGYNLVVGVLYVQLMLSIGRYVPN